MKNTSTGGSDRFGRSVQQKRSHDKRTVASNHATVVALIRATRNRALGKPAKTMRTGHDLKRAAMRATVVKMQPDGNELLDHGNRRLHVERAFFLRPSRERGMIDFFAHRDAQILMQ